MASASRTPPALTQPFPPAAQFSGEEILYKSDSKVGLFSKSRSLTDVSTTDEAGNTINRILRTSDGNPTDSLNSRYSMKSTMYARNDESTAKAETRFSPSDSSQNGNKLLKGNDAKGRSNYSAGVVWSGFKDARTSIDQSDDIFREHADNNNLEQFFMSTNANSDNYKLGVEDNDNPILQNFCSISAGASQLYTGVARDPVFATKAFTITSQSYASDIGNASVNNRVTSLTHNQHTAHWEARNIGKLGRKLYNEKKLEEQYAGGEMSDAKSLSERAAVAMNNSSLSLSPVAATDLSQHGNIHQREERASSKVHPNLLLSPHSLEARQRNSQRQGVKEGGGGEGFSLPDHLAGKEEKRFCIGNFKHSVWGGFGPPTIFSEQQQQQQQTMPNQQAPYDSTFYSECSPSGLSHIPARHYDVNPMLLKDSNGVLKHDVPQGHHGNIGANWDKSPHSFDRMIGAMYKPERTACYLKPPPVDLDDLSEDERERMRVKRERNRVAAAKCRNRRRELLERLEKEAEQLEREQEVLRENVKKLQAQKRKWGGILDKHEPTCSNKVDTNSGKTFAEKSSAEQTTE